MDNPENSPDILRVTVTGCGCNILDSMISNTAPTRTIHPGPRPGLNSPVHRIQSATAHASLTRPPAPPEKSQEQPTVHVARVSPPVGQFVIQTLLQIAGFGVAIAFGVYAVQSVAVGNTANEYGDKSVRQAVVSNQLAMMAICLAMNNQTAAVSSICDRIIQGADSVLPTVAEGMFTSLPPARSTATASYSDSRTAMPTATASNSGQDSISSSPPSPSSRSPSITIIVAGVVGGFLTLTVVLSTSACLFRRAHKRATVEGPERVALGNKFGTDKPYQAAGASRGNHGISGAAALWGQRFRDTFIDSRVSSGI
ncbi:hypothetical protein PV10_07317 [Exophiala mesophila]|uniref:Uncharacterized protein n=1 Tax=Exophiala mesophila TaxID=212818 RepID=A0A0D1Z7P7_EXOME|nr:uncharacterized protein PV10_07317 [Exophiala mesophila]KIV89964.1 hypothetical protein PV10_07317 [Exophiala mesophila]